MAIFLYDTPGPFHKSEQFMKLLSREEQDVLLQHFAASTDSRQRKRIAAQIIQSNIPLLIKISKRYVRAGFTREDVLQTACIGLYRGIEHYNPSLGARLFTYATYWIILELKCAYRTESRTIQIPQREWGRKYRAQKALRKDPLVKLSPEMSEAQFYFNSTNTQSLHAPFGKGEWKKTLEEIIYDPQTRLSDNALDHFQTVASLNQALQTLSQEEITILEQRFGPLTQGASSAVPAQHLTARSQQTKHREQQILTKLKNRMQPRSCAS